MSLYDELVAAGGNSAPMSLSDELMAAGKVATPADLPRKTLPQPEPLSFMDRMLAKVPSGLVNNSAVAGSRNFVTAAAAPTVGAAQLIANAIPPLQSVAKAIPGVRALANVMPDAQPTADSYNQRVAAMLRKDADATKETGVFSTMDKFAGGLASPINLVMASRAVPPAILKAGESLATPATSLGARAAQGAGIGAAGGLTAPVEVGDSGKYWGQKAVQTGLGAVGGAVMAPAIGAIGDRIMAGINSRGFNPAGAAKNADQIIEGALRESGQKVDDLPPEQLASLRNQVVASLKQGKNLDVAAALRKHDFETEGILPTLGQVTRDPMQWAAEQNVRGVTGVGEPVTARLASGNREITNRIGQYGTNAQEVPAAAQKIAAALKAYDTTQSDAVSSAYQAARQSAGKDLDVPLEGLAQDYASTLDRFGDKIPKALQGKFAALGLDPASPSNQKKVFTFETADKLLKDINSHYGVDKPTDTALGQLNAAVKKAVSSADASGGPFAPAVALARDRFKALDAVPALEAASNGQVDDRFVQKYVINSPSTPQVQKLAALLREQAPDAYQETRQQIGAHLGRAAFGENAAGDKSIAQESYNRALRNIGTGKLEAFFEPDEIEQMKRLGRLGAYQVSPPAASASNYSSTASALANLLRKGAKIPVAGPSLKYGGDYLEAKNALDAQVPVAPNLTPEQRRFMSKALLALTGGAAATMPGAIGQ